MQHYKITWTIRSPLETELQSDTIFGHFCWAFLHEKCKKELEAFLKALRDSPVFMLSSAFPKGYLPFPVSLPVTIPDFEKLRAILKWSDSKEDKIMFAQLKKKLKKAQWISTKYWLENHNNFSLPALYNDVWEKAEKKYIDKLYENQDILKEKPLKAETISITHNTINRLTGTTSKEGPNLYDEPTTFFEEGAEFESYLSTDYFSKDELLMYFEIIQNGGFGKNKNTGKGHFEISLEEYTPPECENPNAYLILSNTVPAKDDPLDCFYNGFTKFGKLGGSFSTTKSPFKYPIFMCAPGSVFLGEKKPVGSLLQNVHPDEKQVVQNTYCYSIPFHWIGGKDD
ncbi:hypothetical protein D4R71_07360 [bacterium]|nr:MAG: hypothetical protein D4R71_07360 [bacterium]